MPYGEKELGTLFYVNPVKNDDHLKIIFYLEN